MRGSLVALSATVAAAATTFYLPQRQLTAAAENRNDDEGNCMPMPHHRKSLNQSFKDMAGNLISRLFGRPSSSSNGPKSDGAEPLLPSTFLRMWTVGKDKPALGTESISLIGRMYDYPGHKQGSQLESSSAKGKEIADEDSSKEMDKQQESRRESEGAIEEGNPRAPTEHLA